ncbi:MAG: phage terminase small subunit-related protein [Desulfomonilaceae bacterium]|nr:phage terminase small subunit-related protein [Desulfomonilaceae bacterium]
MRKNEDRKLAEETFLRDRGRVTNKDLAKALGVHPATVARWKKLDEWDIKLVQSISNREGPADVDDMYQVDLKHLGLLNERIEAHLEKSELPPSEILELAQAKFHIMHCMEIINDQVRYPIVPDFEEDQHDFD